MHDGLQHHGQISLVPDDLIAGGSMNLMGFGGESSVYVCQDTPAGEYDITLTAVDGVGGQRDFAFTVIVSTNSVEGRANRWGNCPIGAMLSLSGTFDGSLVLFFYEWFKSFKFTLSKKISYIKLYKNCINCI